VFKRKKEKKKAGRHQYGFSSGRWMRMTKNHVMHGGLDVKQTKVGGGGRWRLANWKRERVLTRKGRIKQCFFAVITILGNSMDMEIFTIAFGFGGMWR